MQIMQHFIWGTWAPMDSGIRGWRGSGPALPPWMLRDDCRNQASQSSGPFALPAASLIGCPARVGVCQHVFSRHLFSSPSAPPSTTQAPKAIFLQNGQRTVPAALSLSSRVIWFSLTALPCLIATHREWAGDVPFPDPKVPFIFLCGTSGKKSACQCRRHETRVRFLGLEDPLEENIATHSSILAWRIPWTEEPGGLQSMWSHRVGCDWAYPCFLKRLCCLLWVSLFSLECGNSAVILFFK